MLEDGHLYEFVPLAAPGKALNMWGYTAQNNVNVNLYTADHSDTQRWRARRAQGGWLLHCAADERYVLDRYRGLAAAQNANIYKEGQTAALLADQLLDITACGEQEGRAVCHIALAAGGRRLCAVDGSNGTGTGKSAAGRGNVWFAPAGTDTALCRWAVLPVGEKGGQPDGMPLTEGARPADLDYGAAHYAAPDNTFPVGQCTWHTWGRVREATGKALTFDIPHGKNGNMWYAHVTNAAGRSTVAPAAGRQAVMCWANGSYGHVAFVEKFDGVYIWLTEANYNGDGRVGADDGIVIKRTLAAAKARAGNFQGFLLL